MEIKKKLMDEVFTQLASNAVTLMSKAAIGMACNVALRRLHNTLVSVRSRSASVSGDPHPENNSMDYGRIQTLRIELERRISLLAPALDLVQTIDKNHRLEYTRKVMDWSGAIKLQVDRLVSILEQEDGSESDHNLERLSGRLKTSVTLTDEHADVHTAVPTTLASSLTEIIRLLENIVNEMDGLCPYLQLTISLLGPTPNFERTETASMSSISLSRLLRASRAIHCARRHAGSKSKSSVPLSECRLYCRLYKLSVGSVKKPLPITPRTGNSGRPTPVSASQQWQWQELYPRCQVEPRMYCRNQPKYSLVLTQDKNDGRYYEDQDRLVQLEFDVETIEKSFYTSSGRLLQLEDSQNPCLVLKILNSAFSSPQPIQGSAQSRGKSKNLNKGPETPVKQTASGSIADYYALELIDLREGDKESSDYSDESESNSDDLSVLEEKVLHRATRRPDSRQTRPKSLTPSPDKANRNRQHLDKLAVFEYLLRLCALEISSCLSIDEIPDDQLIFALSQK